MQKKGSSARNREPRLSEPVIKHLILQEPFLPPQSRKSIHSPRRCEFLKSGIDTLSVSSQKPKWTVAELMKDDIDELRNEFPNVRLSCSEHKKGASRGLKPRIAVPLGSTGAFGGGCPEGCRYANAHEASPSSSRALSIHREAPLFPRKLRQLESDMRPEMEVIVDAGDHRHKIHLHYNVIRVDVDDGRAEKKTWKSRTKARRRCPEGLVHEGKEEVYDYDRTYDRGMAWLYPDLDEKVEPVEHCWRLGDFLTVAY